MGNMGNMENMGPVRVPCYRKFGNVMERLGKFEAFGRFWKGLRGLGSVWERLREFGRVFERLGELGRLGES